MASSYDPRALLNPKGARSQSAKSKSVVDSSSKSRSVASAGAIDVAAHQDRGSRPMLEAFHGLQNRAERPSKRVKVQAQDDEDIKRQDSRSNASRRTNGGIIGSYMRPSLTENPKSSIAALVDLTNEEDTEESDSEVKVLKSLNLANEQEVCFGMIHTDVHAHAIPGTSGNKSQFDIPTQWPIIRCTLHRILSDDTIIEVRDPHDFAFGRIATDAAKVLAPVMDSMRKIRTQARLTNRPKQHYEKPHDSCSARFKIMVNLYGRRADAEKVGRVFGQHNLWLKNPIGAEVGYPTCNPHASRAPVIAPPSSVSRSNNLLSDTRTIEEATQAVSRVFDHFANHAKPLEETEAVPPIVTPLLPHQKQALTFMLGQEQPRTYGSMEEENSSLWRKKLRSNGSVTYQDVVTGLTIKEEPDQVFGGLLADAMGLGKTLEALALVVHTLDQAKGFGNQALSREETDKLELTAQSSATLIVAPVSTVKNWEDQIQEHITPKSLGVYVYHGTNREKDPTVLAKNDIVISTYGTIAFECSKRAVSISPIRRIKWFRIILDEAHTIREPRAIQSQAMYSLYAQRRWCLTGTPIQNRIDDLGSLTKFLRLYPYDTAMRFNQYIRSPAVSGDANFLKALRIFVDSFTLRRLKDRIDLPKREDLIEKLVFTKEEQRLHNYFKDISHAQVVEIGKQKDATGKAPAIQHSQVLKGIMTLRLISAHGRELLKEKDLEKLKGQTFDDAIDVDEHARLPSINERTAYETLSLMTEAGIDICRQCDRRISGDSLETDDIENEDVRAYVLPCLDIVCGTCFANHKDAFVTTHEDDELNCPWCAARITASYVAIAKSFAEVLDIAPEDTTAGRSQDASARRHVKPHTKTRALLRDLSEMREVSKRVIVNGEPPIKAVVFSEFTSHLDLLEVALSDNGYGFVRIDGTMLLNQRKRVLDQLNTNDHVTILLASIKAAGQGLNLTCASRAFIMEPLWNPAAEIQAVDRIYRIGQKREVMIKRYQMKDSIEEKIVELQDKKQKLADLSLNKNHKALSRKDIRAEHMKDLLDLFK